MRRIILALVVGAVAAAVLAPSAAALRFTDESYFTPVGIVGHEYHHQFGGAAGCGPALPYQYRILNGSLPAGLTLSKDGHIRGTPTAPGESSFWVELSDEDPPSANWCLVQKAEREFKILILPDLSVEQKSLPGPIIKGHPYSFKLTAAGGGTQTWSLLSGALPPGLTLGSDGTLAGTPTQLGDFTFMVKVAADIRSDTETLTLRVIDELKAVPPTTVPPAEVGIAVKPLTLAATGGTAPYKWAWAQGATPPAGLTLTAETGQLAGTPAAAGLLQITITVTDANGLTANVQVTLDVKAKLAIATKRLRQAKVGKAFRAKIVTSGGVLPLKRLKVVSGRFPIGIRLDRALGEIVGTPRLGGTFTITIEATDALGATARQTLVLKVLPKAKAKKK
jgi:hypothetical protein